MTTWSDQTPHNNHRRQWLLANGEIIEQPTLEASGSGIRLRIKGAEESFYRKDKAKVLEGVAQAKAKAKRTHVWIPVDGFGNMRSQLGYDPEEQRAEFTIKGGNIQRIRLWWHFKHKTLPIGAYLTIGMWQMTSPKAHYVVNTNLCMPFTTPNTGQTTPVLKVLDGEFSVVRNALKGGDEAEATHFEDLVHDQPPGWEMLGIANNLIERSAVEHLLAQVRAADELDTIKIPDLRNPGSPSWLELDLVDSNLNGVGGQFTSDLVDYLEAEGATARAATLYQELIDTLRGCGMVTTGAVRSNEFMSALLSNTPVTLTLGNALMEGEEKDSKHALTADLATGTFVVTCDQMPIDKDEIAYAWEESLLRAEVTGKKDTLLAYAERYALTQHERRAKQIIGERRLTTSYKSKED